MERVFIPAIIGLAPVLTLLLSWAPGGAMQLWAASVRGMALPVLGSELFVIVIAFRNGLPALLRQLLMRPIVLLPLAVLIAIMFYTALAVAPDRPAAVARSIIWLIHLLFGVSIAQLCGRLFPRDYLVAFYLAGFLIFVALFGIFALIVDDPGFDWTRGLPAVTHIRHLGYYAAAMIGLSIGLFAAAQDSRIRLATVIVCLIAFTFALWTGARGTIAAAVVGYAAGFFLFPALRTPRAVLGFVAAGVLGAAVAYAIPAPGELMGVSRTVVATINPKLDVTTGRTVIWRGVSEAIEKRPVIGWGEGQMTHVATYSDMNQPHNVILQWLLAWGVLGTLCIVLLAAPFAWRSIGSVRAGQAELLAPMMGLIVIGAYSAFDGTLFHIQSVSIFAAFIGMAAGCKPEERA